MASTVPTLRFERQLMREGARVVIGCDEVGRGAIAGPVGVGVSVVHEQMRSAPVGLKDSKLLTEQRREELYPGVARWARDHAVGLASNDEVETIGIIRCLGLAASRAFEAILDSGVQVADAVVILDGSHDWLTPALTPEVRALGLRVVTRIKADRSCAAVAAASVLAKVERDRLMIAADDVHPGYLWASNKGYASSEHYAGIDRLGPSPLHRWSWLKQPGLFDLLDEPASAAFEQSA